MVALARQLCTDYLDPNTELSEQPPAQVDEVILLIISKFPQAQLTYEAVKYVVKRRLGKYRRRTQQQRPVGAASHNMFLTNHRLQTNKLGNSLQNTVRPPVVPVVQTKKKVPSRAKKRKQPEAPVAKAFDFRKLKKGDAIQVDSGNKDLWIALVTFKKACGVDVVRPASLSNLLLVPFHIVSPCMCVHGRFILLQRSRAAPRVCGS
jgi:hypothetical protein